MRILSQKYLQKYMFKQLNKLYSILYHIATTICFNKIYFDLQSNISEIHLNEQM